MDYLELRELYHHGIKGQKWGYRKYQNEDGTLTEAGKARYRQNSTTGELDSIGKKRFKQDQLAIKGQKLYESGESIIDINTKKRVIHAGEAMAGIVMLNIAQNNLNNYKQRGYYTAGEWKARNIMMGAVGAMAVADIAMNVSSNKKKKALQAYYSEGSKQVVPIQQNKK